MASFSWQINDLCALECTINYFRTFPTVKIDLLLLLLHGEVINIEMIHIKCGIFLASDFTIMIEETYSYLSTILKGRLQSKDT